MLRCLLAFGLIVLSGLAAAISPEPKPFVGRPGLPIYDRVANQTYSLEELVAEFGGSRPGFISGGAIERLLPKAGEIVKWGGRVALPALIVQLAAEWGAHEVNGLLDNQFEQWYRQQNPNAPAFPRTYDLYNHPTTLVQGPYKCHDGFWSAFYGDGRYFAEVSWVPWAKEFRSGSYTYDDPARANQIVQEELKWCNLPDDTLADVLKKQPEVANDLNKLLKRYIETHPQDVKKMILDHYTDNQFEDNPYYDLATDSDGDGVPDYVEYEHGGVDFVNDPSKIPDLTDDSAKDLSKDPTKDPSKDPSKDPDKDLAKDPSKDPAKDPSKDPSKDPDKDPAKDPSKDPLRDKRDRCSAAGRVWDDVNDMCGGAEPQKKDEWPVSDNCGDMSLPRLMQYPASWGRDLILPCQNLGDLIHPLVEAAKTRFPFSVGIALNGWFNTGGSESANVPDLPKQIGPIPLDFGWLTGLWVTIKTLVGVALYVWFGYWLLDRYSPRPHI